jgi:hypothetical protein
MKNFLITFLFFIFATNNILLAQECLEGDCANGIGTKKVQYKDFRDPTLGGFETKGIYKGGFKNGKFHGDGTYVIKDWGLDYDLLRPFDIVKVEYVHNEGLIEKSISHAQNGLTFENIWEDKGDTNYAVIKSGTYYFGDMRLTAESYKDNKPVGKVFIFNTFSNKFGILSQKGTMKFPCGTKENGPKLDGEVTDVFNLDPGVFEKYVNIYECGRLKEGTLYLNQGSKFEGTYTHRDSTDGKLITDIYNGLRTYPDGRKVKYKEGKAMTLSVVVQDNLNTKEETDEFVKIKNEAINAINKAQSCYNSLDALGQSQMSGGLLDVKKTHLHAKTTEKNMKISNIDVTRATELHNWYGLTTREANRIVSAYCN